MTRKGNGRRDWVAGTYCWMGSADISAKAVPYVNVTKQHPIETDRPQESVVSQYNRGVGLGVKSGRATDRMQILAVWIRGQAVIVLEADDISSSLMRLYKCN